MWFCGSDDRDWKEQGKSNEVKDYFEDALGMGFRAIVVGERGARDESIALFMRRFRCPQEMCVCRKAQCDNYGGERKRLRRKCCTAFWQTDRTLWNAVKMFDLLAMHQIKKV